MVQRPERRKPELGTPASGGHRDCKKYKFCNVSSLALLKMAKSAASGGTQEVMGMLLGKVDGDTFQVTDTFALPVEATETRVNAMGEAYEYIVQYMDNMRMAGHENKAVVGWYHSHPGYGCFLSRIDIGTQYQNQQFQDPFVAIVIDPLKTADNESVEIGAFRTSSDHEYYELEVSYTSNRLDGSILAALDTESWPAILAKPLAY